MKWFRRRIRIPARVIAELHDVGWQDPWFLLPTEDMHSANGLARQLRNELPDEHPYRDALQDAIPVARRADRDDVLFFLPRHGDGFAVVHLTWTSRETNGRYFPTTILFESLAGFVEDDLGPTHQEWSSEGP